MAFGKTAAQIQEEAQQTKLGGGDASKSVLPSVAPQPMQRPTPGAVNPDRKVGVVQAFFHGTPDQQNGILQDDQNAYNPDYKPTWGESLATAISPATAGRKLAQTVLELNPDVQNARNEMDKLRAIDKEKADQLEAQTLGKKHTLGENLTIAGAAGGELALTLLPFFKFGKAAAATEEALAISNITKGVSIAEKIAVPLTKGERLAQAVIASGKAGGFGALYGGLYNLHQYDADWGKAAEGALWGGVTGAATLGFGKTLGFIGKEVGAAASKPIERAGQILSEAGSKIKGVSEKYLPTGVHTTLFSLEAGFQKTANQLEKVGNTDVADYIKSIPKRLRGLDAESQAAAGKLQLEMIDAGLVEAPTKGAAKRLGVVGKYAENGGNAEKMKYFSEVLEAHGAYSNPKVQAEAIARDPLLQKLDNYRKAYYATSQEAGALKSVQSVDNYLPHQTATISLSKKSEVALSKARTAEERVAIYEANDPHVKEMIDYSVNTSKKYTDVEKAYGEYYDYTSFVKGDQRVMAKDNKFFQGMVERGDVQTRQEAEQLLSKNSQAQRKSLTGRASSLDYDRELELPWYDPNAGRVMSTYSMDAISRINYAKEFGAGDEKLWEAISNVQKTASLGRDEPLKVGKDLENIFRVALGTTEHSSKAMAASRWVRAMQVPKLAFSAIVNLGQTMNNLLAADIPSTLKGLQMAFSEEGVRKAIKSGALTESFLRQASEFNSGGGTGKVARFMKINGFNWSEVFNRSVGANVSDKYVTKSFTNLMKKYGLELGDEAQGAKIAGLTESANKDIAREVISLQKTMPEVPGPDIYKMAKEKVLGKTQAPTPLLEAPPSFGEPAPIPKDTSKYADLNAHHDFVKGKQDRLASVFDQIEKDKPPEYWALKDLGVDYKDVMSKGYMDAEDKAIAAFRFVEKTQFTGNPLDLPSFASSPIGKVVFQFKSFAYQQSKLALGVLKNQFQRGQYREALKNIGILGTIFPMGNAALKDVRSLITQEKRPTTAFEQWHEGLFDAASFGLISDFIQKSESGGLSDWIIGVGPKDATTYLEALTKSTLGKDPKGAAKDILKQATKNLGAQPLVNIFAPSKAPGKSTLDQIRGKKGAGNGGGFSGI